MRLVSCPACRTLLDVGDGGASSGRCPCGAAVEAVAAAEPKPCPGCEEPLVARRVRDVQLLACSWCDGLWVPASSFDVLMRRVSRGSTGAASRGPGDRPARTGPGFDGEVVYRRCPECRQRMARENYGRAGSVILDSCGAHGSWFDADELERVAAASAVSGRRARPAPRLPRCG